jgi:hypothetical protein
VLAVAEMLLAVVGETRRAAEGLLQGAEVMLLLAEAQRRQSPEGPARILEMFQNAFLKECGSGTTPRTISTAVSIVLPS